MFIRSQRLWGLGISQHQEEPAPLLSTLCVGESRHVSEGRKTEGVLQGDGISAPHFSEFSAETDDSGRKAGNWDDLAHSFAV